MRGLPSQVKGVGLEFNIQDYQKIRFLGKRTGFITKSTHPINRKNTEVLQENLCISGKANVHLVPTAK